jgi:integrase
MQQCITDELIYSLTAQNITINLDDLELIEGYLQLKKKTGSKNMISIRIALFDLFQYSKTTSIKEITRSIYLDYCYNHLDSYAYASKIGRKALQLAFFRYYKELIEETDPSYVIPIPVKTFKFEKPMEKIASIEADLEDTCFSIEKLLLILKTLNSLSIKGKFQQTRTIFYIIILQIFCGMRISEALTIRRENFHLDSRYLVTGLEENARKNKMPLYFVFHSIIATLFKEFMLQQQQIYPNSEWVFTGKNGISPIGENTINHHMRILTEKLGFEIKTHSFRKTLITNYLHESKTPTHVVETLTNHAISSVIFKNYDKYNIEERKKDYFEYLPKSYDVILDYLRTL